MTENKRFTVSITPEMDKQLDELKRNLFYNKTNSEMIRELIKKGLQEIRK